MLSATQPDSMILPPATIGCDEMKWNPGGVGPIFSRSETYPPCPKPGQGLPVRASSANSRASAVVEMIRSEEHTSELQSLMRISYAVFCLKKKTPTTRRIHSLHSI